MENNSLIKNKLFFIIAILLTIPLLYFIFDRIQLTKVWKHVIGKVENVTAYNGRCSRWSWKHRTYYDCTKFTAIIWFDTLPPPIHSIFNLSWWSKRWRNQPISYSSRQIWDPTRVIYDPNKLSRAYEDTIWWIWWVPFMNFIIQLSFLFWAFSEKKEENY